MESLILTLLFVVGGGAIGYRIFNFFNNNFNNNYMLYPFFSWGGIDKVAKMRNKYTKKYSELYDKVYKSKEKGLLSEDFKRNLRQYIEYRTVSEICQNEYLFMLRANGEIIAGKNKPMQIMDEHMHKIDRVFEDDMGSGLIYWPSKKIDELIEKECQSELKRLQKIRLSSESKAK